MTERVGLRNYREWGRGQWQEAVGGSGVLVYAYGSIWMVVARTGRRAGSGMRVGCVQGDTQQASARWLAGTGIVEAEVAARVQWPEWQWPWFLDRGSDGTREQLARTEEDGSAD